MGGRRQRATRDADLDRYLVLLNRFAAEGDAEPGCIWRPHWAGMVRAEVILRQRHGQCLNRWFADLVSQHRNPNS